MRTLSTLLILLTTFSLSGQFVDSDCTVPPELLEAYDRDVKGLVVKRMQGLESSDFNEVIIPQEWQDSIMEGLAAIYNAVELPQRDSVFNIYCVHDNSFTPMVPSLIVGVNTDSTWVQAWADGNTLTGFAPIDDLLQEYNLTLESYSSFGFAVLQTDSLYNMYALGNLLANSVPGIEYGEPNFIIGLASSIEYQLFENERIYLFFYEWNDCFDGCDNFYSWRFLVTPDCRVEFRGSDTGGAFGPEPLPPPTNCNISTSVVHRQLQQNVEVMPNPAHNIIQIQVDNPVGLSAGLFDAFGRLIRQQSLEANLQLDVHDLPAGLYFLRISNEEERSTTLRVVIE